LDRLVEVLERPAVVVAVERLRRTLPVNSAGAHG
jgi:hypothetical protein